MAEKKKLFRIVDQQPKMVSSENSQQMILDAIALLQQVERNYIGRDSVTVALRHNDPIMVICGSDLHAGSITSDYQSISELRDYALTHENVGIVLLGDEVEGLKEAYMNTNTARTPIDFHQQLDFMRGYFLEPLAEQGKILAMVSGYWGHPGWAEDATTINTWRLMTDGLDIPLLRNGGELNVKFANGQTQTQVIWHNPPGKSRFDPVSGLRDAAFPVSESKRADGYLAGHLHRMGVAKEIYAGAKAAVYYIASGTTKGSSASVPPDRFGVKLGLPLADPLGQGVILEPKRKRRGAGKNYPFSSFQQGQQAFDALRLLDRAENQGITEELLSTIKDQVEAKPEISLLAGSSRTSGGEYTESKPAETLKVGGEVVQNPYSKMKMKAPYDSLTYDVRTRLPLALHLISNARLGSSSEGYDELLNYQAELIANNPHSLVVYLRNMIDKDAGNVGERIDVLDRFVEMINGTKEQTLAIMMCESLRQGSWKRSVGKSLEQAPLAPGSYLANETQVPLIHHLSLIKLAVGPAVRVKEKPLYVGAFADKLLRHGSFSRPTYGLRRMYDLYAQEKPGFVAGGHMPHAGAMTFFDGLNPITDHPMLVAPGWFAKYVDTMGKGNVMQGAEPGQAIIFMPGSSQSDYLAFPTVNKEETAFMHDALTLLKGLEILGLTDQVLKKTK
ncbi:MAG: hypothetical protein UX12_C0015G0002 [Candidatus Collierbacteria bacterium GW2011_GWC1_45_47]|uniref:Uncharacterized protein n=6 Tax=Candidatus Collieribacteriota TaxID=1752725 RepID=A0A0G1KF42_9BACT|nr:MAG: hypothetical protein UW23_C0018G0006 [Candidatus Collierbacteria bacterium GW2011_GWA1_44_12]KKT37708.1 MAG: hypothetical protein UW26_C0026G0010 [Candidatus Collierbacteria bacterium GW2011_GWF1_44_12]KKT46494.1 MAG: hypothetical protein UW35_C0013G0017 [Candidatus Collierbacteria bacterium GW2011_GWF2_44_15]KKT68124.1 MAG: hypothetical protein UW62_C0004G0011 [Candidatus Collierbacteria bacterium GW2011_GWB1_44_35]KKT97697.1 MAG: hypothetical protein UW99_C0030G0008 [Candidatus Collie